MQILRQPLPFVEDARTGWPLVRLDDSHLRGLSDAELVERLASVGALTDTRAVNLELIPPVLRGPALRTWLALVEFLPQSTDQHSLQKFEAHEVDATTIRGRPQRALTITTIGLFLNARYFSHDAVQEAERNGTLPFLENEMAGVAAHEFAHNLRHQLPLALQMYIDDRIRDEVGFDAAPYVEANLRAATEAQKELGSYSRFTGLEVHPEAFRVWWQGGDGPYSRGTFGAMVDLFGPDRSIREAISERYRSATDSKYFDDVAVALGDDLFGTITTQPGSAFNTSEFSQTGSEQMLLLRTTGEELLITEKRVIDSTASRTTNSPVFVDLSEDDALIAEIGRPLRVGNRTEHYLPESLATHPIVESVWVPNMVRMGQTAVLRITQGQTTDLAVNVFSNIAEAGAAAGDSSFATEMEVLRPAFSDEFRVRAQMMQDAPGHYL